MHHQQPPPVATSCQRCARVLVQAVHVPRVCCIEAHASVLAAWTKSDVRRSEVLHSVRTQVMHAAQPHTMTAEHAKERLHSPTKELRQQSCSDDVCRRAHPPTPKAKHESALAQLPSTWGSANANFTIKRRPDPWPRNRVI